MFYKRFFSLSVTFLLVACASNKPLDQQVVEDIPTHPKATQRPVSKSQDEVKPGDPKYRPVRSSYVNTVKLPTGSLFDETRALGLYQPASYYKIGDMILVQVEEKTTADKSLRFDTDKKGNFELKPVALNAGPINVGGNDLSAEYEQSKDFNSSAKTKQNNSLRGDITVYVLDIMPNGNLIVAGEKWITLNTGEEFIRFSGEIRVSDIDIDNTISSVKVGNAHIEYSGVGELHENQEASLLSKLFGILD